MILYLDTSALVKRYLLEAGTLEVNQWISQAALVSTAIITRAEMASAICRAERMELIDGTQREVSLKLFRADWENIGRLPISEAAISRADALACQYDLRGYDAVHLACAAMVRESLGEQVSLATYDRQLWKAGLDEGFRILPPELS